MLMPLSLFMVLHLFCFSVSDKNEAGEVSVKITRVSINHNIKRASAEFNELLIFIQISIYIVYNNNNYYYFVFVAPSIDQPPQKYI